MTRRMWTFAVLAWVGVVIVGSALTWLAIDRAGQQVTSSAVFSEVAPTPTPTPRPAHHPSRKPTPKHPARVTKSPTTPPASPPPTTPAAPVVRSQIGTWSGTAGSVTASCQARMIRLVGASPNTGWQVQRGDTAGSSIEVNFTRSTSQVQIQATCSNGAPAFQVDSSGSGSGPDS